MCPRLPAVSDAPTRWRVGNAVNAVRVRSGPRGARLARPRKHSFATGMCGGIPPPPRPAQHRDRQTIRSSVDLPGGAATCVSTRNPPHPTRHPPAHADATPQCSTARPAAPLKPGYVPRAAPTPAVPLLPRATSGPSAPRASPHQDQPPITTLAPSSTAARSHRGRAPSPLLCPTVGTGRLARSGCGASGRPCPSRRSRSTGTRGYRGTVARHRGTPLCQRFPSAPGPSLAAPTWW